MIEALAGVLGAVHLRQPWLGGACLAFIAVLALVLWAAWTRHLPWRRQLAAPAAGLGVALISWGAVDLVWRLLLITEIRLRSIIRVFIL